MIDEPFNVVVECQLQALTRAADGQARFYTGNELVTLVAGRSQADVIRESLFHVEARNNSPIPGGGTVRRNESDSGGQQVNAVQGVTRL